MDVVSGHTSIEAVASANPALVQIPMMLRDPEVAEKGPSDENIAK
jgi:hypothetical protein